MAVPIRRAGEVVGSIWLEDLPPASRRAAGAELARTVAQVEAVRIQAPQPTQEPAEAPERDTGTEADEASCDQVVPGTDASRRETSVDAGRQEALWQQRDEPEAVEVFPAVTVLTVLLPNSQKQARPVRQPAVLPSPSLPPTRWRVCSKTRRRRSRSRISRSSATASSRPPGSPAIPAWPARAIAQAALALRDFRRRGGERTAHGNRQRRGAGQRRRPRTKLLQSLGRCDAACVRDGAIGAARRRPGHRVAYRHLSGAFLLRPRGAFYLHPEGEAAVYLLAGRI